MLTAIHGWADYYTPVYNDTIINGGTYGNIEVFNSAALDVYDAGIDMLTFQNTSIGRIHSGSIHTVFVTDSAALHLWGGQISVMYANNSTVDFYAQSINFDPANSGNDTHIYGLWGDGTAFNFMAWRTGTYNEQFIFNQIPEPSTITLMLIAGVLFFRRRR
jgi:hypothetical protein